jgi:cytosine/adenosine deaminase-related metal-dependent hydrolase
MQKISADYIFTGNAAPIKNGVVILHEDGSIIAIVNPNENPISLDDVQKFNGIICPGFINAHCHLELSYLKNQISKKTTLPGFVKELVQKRFNFSEEEMQQAAVDAEQEMFQNGIVAVGDIANGNSTFELKAKQKLHYHTFLEIFEIDEQKAEATFNKANKLKASYFNPEQISIVPHAPYSVSKKLMALIARQNNLIASIHSQETPSENDFFTNKSGVLYEQMAAFNPKVATWEKIAQGALHHFIPFFKNAKALLLVHNTFANEKDIDFVTHQPIAAYWCCCPKANLFIENTLPDFTLFNNKNLEVVIGTDSLASNDKLCILDELKTISNHAEIPLETILKWGTFNGAKALNILHQYGSLEKGKKPGINLLKNIDLTHLKLTDNTTVQKLY